MRHLSPSLCRKIVTEKPAPLPETLSTALRFLIMKCLEKNVNRRPNIDQILHYTPMREQVRDCARSSAPTPTPTVTHNSRAPSLPATVFLILPCVVPSDIILLCVIT